MKKKQQKTMQALSLFMEGIYWFFFIIVALFVQFFIPGIDVMIVGILIVLPERKILLGIILFCICIVLQEATGILTFGLLLLEYTLLIIAFFAGRIIFAVGTFFFIFLLSLFISFLYFVFVQIFGSVQGIYIDPVPVLYSSIVQALVIPLMWYPMRLLYKRCTKRGNTI